MVDTSYEGWVDLMFEVPIHAYRRVQPRLDETESRLTDLAKTATRGLRPLIDSVMLAPSCSRATQTLSRRRRFLRRFRTIFGPHQGCSGCSSAT